jgi:hypothetical protein
MNGNVSGGLLTLTPGLLSLKESIDSCGVLIGRVLGAEPIQFAPIMRTSDLDRLDYFTNFPHLPLVVSRTDAEEVAKQRHLDGKNQWQAIKQTLLRVGEHVIPPAACYNVYFHLQNTRLLGTRVVTTAANCCRNESSYHGMERLLAFTQREIVFIGDMEEVVSGLKKTKERILWLAGEFGLPVRVVTATDPFFRPDSSRATTQRLFPVKEELVYGDSLAISSFNFHRNFFGERCRITTQSGEHAYTACMGIGVERWMHVILEICKGDLDAANELAADVRRTVERDVLSKLEAHTLVAEEL